MFPTTRQSIIERVQRGGEDGRKALGEWFTAYRPAIRQFVLKRFRRLAQEVDDVVAGFIDHKVLNGVLLTGYTPQPGRRFRSLLWVALHHYCIEVLRSKGRQMTTVSLNEDFDKPDPADPDEADVLWGRQVFGRAIRRMKRACEKRHSDTEMRVWGVFEARFLRPFRGKQEAPYPELVARYGFSSPGVAQKDATKGKRMFAQALLSVVSEYAGNEDARSELDDLWRIARELNRARMNRTHEPDSPDKDQL